MAKRLIHILLVLLMAVTSVMGANDAGRETPFSLGAGARALGLGGGFTALADDGSAIYYNPAGFPRLEYQELSFMHATLFEGTLYDFAYWVVPSSDNGGVGIGFMRVGTNDIVGRENFDTTNVFDYSHSQFLFSYGRDVAYGVALGATFKVVNQSLGDLSDFAYGADFGVTIDIYKRLSLGAIARDIVAPKLELDSASETTPWTVMGGLALRDLPLSDKATLSTAVDLEKVEDRSVKVHTGVELIINNSYALRAGYDRDDFSFGAGLAFKRIKLDYAYKLLDYVEDSHRFSLTFQIGSSAREHRQIVREQTSEEPIDENRVRFLELKERGDGFFHQFQFDSALVYYQQALIYDPDNLDIPETMAAIEKARRNEEEQQQKLKSAEDEVRAFMDRYYDQAYLFHQKKYYSASLDLLQLILEIDPGHEKAAALKAEIEAAKQADIDLYLSQATQAEEDGRIVEAIEAYNQILDLDAENEAIVQARQQALASLDITQQLNLGIKLFSQGRYQAAKRRFNSVLRINSSEPVALEYLGKIESAQEKVSTLEDLQRDRVIWDLYLEGIRHMRNSEYEKAIEAWEKVLEAYPNNTNTVNNLEQARLRLQTEQSN